MKIFLVVLVFSVLGENCLASSLEVSFLGGFSSHFQSENGLSESYGGVNSFVLPGSLGGDVSYLIGRSYGLETGLSANFGSNNGTEYNFINPRLGFFISGEYLNLSLGASYFDFEYEDGSSELELDESGYGVFTKFGVKIYRSLWLQYKYEEVETENLKIKNSYGGLYFKKSF